MFEAAVLIVIWILFGLFINSWWPTWLPLYVIGAGFLSIPMIIAHSDTLLDVLFKPSAPKPIREPEPTRRLVPPQEATRLVWQEIGPQVQAEPWRSLFLYVVTDLVDGEQIWDHSLENHTRAIVSALTPLTKDLPQIFPSPLSAPLFNFLKDPEAISLVVWNIVYRKYQDKHLSLDLSDVHPGARDNLMGQCLSTPYRVVIGRVWKGEMKKIKRSWEGEPYEDYEYVYLPVEGDHKESYLAKLIVSKLILTGDPLRNLRTRCGLIPDRQRTTTVVALSRDIREQRRRERPAYAG
jgi:hypothetical protein